jgi:hypothetical protein
MSAKPTSPPPAYFLSLSLENVRSFGEKQTISFARENGRPAPWTIILGDNGVGKTTVLKCLGYFMTYDKPQKFDEHSIYYSINFPRDTQPLPLRNNGASLSSISGAFAIGKGIEDSKLVLPDTVSFIQFFPSVSHKSGFDVGFNLSHNVLRGLTCYGYGASRSTGSSTLGEVQDPNEFCLSLYNEHADLLNAEEWFLQADYRIKSDDSPLIRQNFELLKAALIDILDEVTEIKVSPVAPGGNPQQGLQFLTPYGWVRLREMSLGYQTMVVWITDFASKLFIRYPESKNPLAEPAIVLIDEIDLHLHPEWQRKLIGYLSRLFPNTQFIATAHSPLVVQAAGDAGANVVLLKRVGDQTIVVQDLEDVRGWRVDQILSSELFDSTPARSPATEEKLARRRTLLAKKKLTKADKETLAQLNAELPPLPFGDTPEVQQADAKIQALLHKLGKQPSAR